MTSFTVIVKTRGVATTFLSDFASSVHGARLLLSEGGKRVRSLGFTRPSCIFSMDLSLGIVTETLFCLFFVFSRNS